MNIKRKPDWLKIQLPKGQNFAKVHNLISKHHLHTICTSGNCPNMGECWDRGTATFMILGNICTRACKFCNVTTGKPLSPDILEPENIAISVKELSLKHCVLTSVDRDDLPDFGATHWFNVISKVKEVNPATTIEALIPDFNGRTDFISTVLEAHAEVYSHNLETVKRLTPTIRSKAKYETSIQVIKQIAESTSVAKTGIMLGLGELHEEVIETMKDALNAGCKVFTIGQYLQPTRKHVEVKEYIHPEVFEEYKKIGLQMGFRHIESSPLVRSSYHAENHIIS